MFETFDHTADLGLRVRAESLESLFAEAARGLTSLIVDDVETVASDERQIIEIESTDLEYLFFDWLSELLYRFETNGWLSTVADVSLDGNTLRATVHGSRFDKDQHKPSHEVKAITYHGLLVQRQGPAQHDSWLGEVIVDI